MSQGPTAPPIGFVPVPADSALSGRFSLGSPVYVTTDGTAQRARANSASTVGATIGLATRGATAGEEEVVQYAGEIALPADSWDAVAGTSGGLVPGARYYVSSASEGEITSTAPVGGGTFVFQVGIARTANILFIELGGPV